MSKSQTRLSTVNIMSYFAKKLACFDGFAILTDHIRVILAAGCNWGNRNVDKQQNFCRHIKWQLHSHGERCQQQID